MRRLHLFELEDQPWFPAVVRDGMTDYLRFASELFRLFDPAVEILERGLRASGGTRIVDLASGGGGCWGRLAPLLREREPALDVVLTDYYPNVTALERMRARHPDVFTVEPDSIDAREVPTRLRGLRTQFLSIHHFRPDDVRRILANAVAAGDPIAFFEGQRRDLEHVIKFSFAPLAILLMTPFNRPWRLSRFVFTYLIPLIPLCTGWDGVVSALRTYRPEELLAIAAEADPDGRYAWEAQELKSGPNVMPYLLGVPAA